MEWEVRPWTVVIGNEPLRDKSDKAAWPGVIARLWRVERLSCSSTPRSRLPLARWNGKAAGLQFRLYVTTRHPNHPNHIVLDKRPQGKLHYEARALGIVGWPIADCGAKAETQR